MQLPLHLKAQKQPEMVLPYLIVTVDYQFLKKSSGAYMLKKKLCLFLRTVREVRTKTLLLRDGYGIEATGNEALMLSS